MSVDAVDEMVRNARIETERTDLMRRSLEVEQSALAAWIFDYVSASDTPSKPVAGYEDDFSEPMHREIWRAVYEIADSGRVVTPMAVYSRLAEEGRDEECKPYLAALGKGLAIGRPADALRLVREMANRRRLAELARELEESAYHLDVQPAQAIADCGVDLEAIRLDRQSQPRSIKEVALRIADGLSKPLPCYPTGLPRLDDALGGGLYAGKLYGLAAKRKHAKTMTAGTMAANIAAAGTPVLFFALEMGEQGISERIIARQLRTNSMAFLSRDNEHLERDVRRWAEACKMPLFFEDRPGLAFPVLQNMAAEYVARHGIKVIIIDYWQLVGGRAGRQSEREHLDRVAQWLADFAKDSGAAILTPAQINRDGETRGGDGLRLACDMYMVQHKVTQPDGRTEGVWVEMLDSRYTPTLNIGSEEQCPFFVNKTGPHLAEFGVD